MRRLKYRRHAFRLRGFRLLAHGLSGAAGLRKSRFFRFGYSARKSVRKRSRGLSIWLWGDHCK